MSFIFCDVLCGFVTKGFGASGFRLPKLSMGCCINGTLQKHHISTRCWSICYYSTEDTDIGSDKCLASEALSQAIGFCNINLRDPLGTCATPDQRSHSIFLSRRQKQKASTQPESRNPQAYVIAA